MYATPIASLEQSHLAGAPGSTVVWSVHITPSPAYWMIVTSVQSDYLPFPAGLSADPDPVTDLLSPWFQTEAFSLHPEADTLVRPLGAFNIRADALAVGVEGALVRIFYDLYEGDPFGGGTQVFPENDAGFIELPSIVSVSVSEIPEPATAMLFVCGLGLCLGRAWRTRTTP
jgi:hypothetical protein